MTEPLRWPVDFPPREGVKRFFVGVRWLGPDISFFRALRDVQAARDRSVLVAWGNDAQRRKLSRIFSAFFQRHAQWPKRYFVPEDSFAVCMYGPAANVLDNKTYDALGELLIQRFEIAVSDTELARLAEGTLGEVVDHFVKKRAGSAGRSSTPG
jgi:hypothetical protein